MASTEKCPDLTGKEEDRLVDLMKKKQNHIFRKLEIKQKTIDRLERERTNLQNECQALSLLICHYAYLPF